MTHLQTGMAKSHGRAIVVKLARRLAIGWTFALATALLMPSARAADGTATLAAILTPEVSLSDCLRLRVDNLDAADASRLRLRLDEHVFADLLPQRRKADEIAFDLTGLRSDKTGGWALLVGRPPLDGTKTVKVALSRADGADLDTAPGAGAVTLVVVRVWRIALGAAIVAIFIVAVLRLGSRTDALRDTTVPDPAPGQRRPYSLGRCQMAFWSVLVTAAFVMIWLVTGDYNAIVSSQSLALLGISGTTAIAAASIDLAKTSAAQAAAAKLGVSPALAAMHRTLWADLLQDSSGWAFHRLQVLAWTLILGVISLWSAYATLALPNFDDNLLVLMGLSSGLYLGFKFPEQPA